MTNYELRIYSWLKSLGITEKYPYIENGVEYLADTLEEVFYKAVLSYDTFSLVKKKYKPYSPNDIRNFEFLLRYQKEIGAYYAPFLTVRRNITEEDVKKYSHDKVKSILNKASRVNRGIYFVSSLLGYTSTTLFENPILQYSEETKRYSKMRIFGRIQKVLLETAKHFDGTVLNIEYPFILKGVERKSESIYEVYELAYQNPNGFELITDNDLYSGQQKRIVNKLLVFGGKENWQK